MCLESAVKGLYIWIIHKQLLTHRGHGAKAKRVMAQSVSIWFQFHLLCTGGATSPPPLTTAAGPKLQSIPIAAEITRRKVKTMCRADEVVGNISLGGGLNHWTSDQYRVGHFRLGRNFLLFIVRYWLSVRKKCSVLITKVWRRHQRLPRD